VLELIIHAAAIAIIVLVISFNFTNYYWQDVSEDSNNNESGSAISQSAQLNAWQFAAKLHELAMLASLSFLVFHYTHKLLVGPRGIPFGLIGYPYTNCSPDMLLHMRFWETGLNKSN
jgi:hypothetical protein